MVLLDQLSTESCEDTLENKLEEIILGYKKYQIVYSAIEFGLFAFLSEKRQANREEISQALGIKGMLVKSYLQTLIEMGLICEQNKFYANSEISEKLFARKDSSNRSDWFKFSGIQNPNWNNLKKTLDANIDPNTNPPPLPSKETIDCLIQKSLCGESPSVMEAITQWDGFSQSKFILDIGGGHALNSIVLCQKNKNLRAAVVDKPYIDQYLKEYHLEGRIEDLGCGIPIESIQGEYDIVIVSHFLYKHRKYLEFPFKVIYQILKPGGLLIANHWFCEIGCAPEQSGISALDKAFLCFGHPLCHVETFSRFFIGEGFSMIAEKDIPSLYGNSRLHVAIKSSVDPTPANKENECSDRCCE